MTAIDHRATAEARIQSLIAALESLPKTADRDALIGECTALTVAIRAFHMEGIRFRMFNVDRLLTRPALAVPPAASEAFADARRHLEAAGFHTRSHQAPTP
jgi:hypothetical protein